MPKWLVRLSGPERELRLLSHVMRGQGRRITENRGEFYLWSQQFDALGGAATVKDLADEMITRASLAVLLLWCRSLRIKSADVIEQDQDRSLHVTTFVATGTLQLQGFPVEVTGGRQPEHDFSRVEAVIERCPSLAKAVAYLQDEPNRPGYYKAYEAIRDANGGDRGLKKKGWVTRRQLSRFTWSAQTDRHHDEPGPPDPMTETECRAFVISLMWKWLDCELAGQPPQAR
jgi:hypothetical protein